MIKVLLENAGNARSLVRQVVPKVGQARALCHAGCDRALDNALITAPDKRDAALIGKLDAVAGRVL